MLQRFPTSQTVAYAIGHLREIRRLKCEKHKHAPETNGHSGQTTTFSLNCINSRHRKFTFLTTKWRNTQCKSTKQSGRRGQSKLNQYNRKRKVKYIHTLIYFDMYMSTVGFSIITSRTHSSCFLLQFAFAVFFPHIWTDWRVLLSFAELLRSIKTESRDTSRTKPSRSSAHIPEKHTAASCRRTDWRRAPSSSRRFPLKHFLIFFFLFLFYLFFCFFKVLGESWLLIWRFNVSTETFRLAVMCNGLNTI